MTEPALSIRNLSVTFLGTNGPVPMVRGLSFDLVPGQLTGLVGESGCGKSVTAHALMNLLPSRSWSVAADRAMLADQSLAGLDERHWRDIRGASMAMIFQQPSRALDPVYPVGAQLARVVRRRDGASRQIAAGRALELLGESGFDDPAGVSAAYPHQLSGGMRQLVMIAMAMAAKPAVLIADEPTTALDVTTQALVIARLKQLASELGSAVLLVSHDLGVIARCCSRVMVMYCGEIIEDARYAELYRQPRHPYSEGLLKAMPRIEDAPFATGIHGSPPRFEDVPAGCLFAPRCYRADDRCHRVPPPATEENDRLFRCHHPL